MENVIKFYFFNINKIPWGVLRKAEAFRLHTLVAERLRTRHWALLIIQ